MAKSSSKNLATALVWALLGVATFGAAYASVPLYRIFCQATGYGGVTNRAKIAPKDPLNQTVVVRFDTNVRDLPLTFTAEKLSETVQIGKTSMAYFKAKNTGSTPITARASYNVVPETAAVYFTKLQCFCFQNQTLQPGQEMEFPVAYYVDKRIVKDQDAKDVAEITLSYTFYPAASGPSAGTKAP